MNHDTYPDDHVAGILRSVKTIAVVGASPNEMRPSFGVTRFLKAIDAAGDGAEMNRFYLEQLSTHPDLMGPEVLDVLRELSEVATLAVVTNGFQKVQIRRLAESGVLNFMEDVFVSEKMDSEKPNRRIFDAALRALAGQSEESADA